MQMLASATGHFGGAEICCIWEAVKGASADVEKRYRSKRRKMELKRI